MELAVPSLSYCPKLLKPPIGISPQLALSFPRNPNGYALLGFCSLPRQLHVAKTESGKRHSRFGALHASEVESPTSTADSQKWLLEPVGDGDSRHLGFKVPMPDSYEIASSTVTVGRLPEKADLVIPVATVSGLHARIEKKEGSLLITDLDSTNGTFVDGKKLQPGYAATALPGSCITFGDTHLAMFRVSKLEDVDNASRPEGQEMAEPGTTGPTNSDETVSKD